MRLFLPQADVNTGDVCVGWASSILLQQNKLKVFGTLLAATYYYTRHPTLALKAFNLFGGQVQGVATTAGCRAGCPGGTGAPGTGSRFEWASSRWGIL